VSYLGVFFYGNSVAIPEFLHTVAEMVRMKAWLSFQTNDAAKCEDIRRA
jgi:hypothetical protein